MRVLHVQRAKGIGGSERHLLTLLPALAERGIDVRMCVLEVGDGARFVDELRTRGVDVVSRPGHGDLAPSLVLELRREIERFRPHLVHTHLVHADAWGLLAARSCRTPTVSSVHGTPAFYTKQPYRAVGRIAGRLAQRRIAISRHVADFLIANRLAPPQRVRVVCYGIDPPSPASHEDRVAARATFGLTASDVAVGIASRLVPGKGHDVLIEAFATLAEDDPSVVLLVAGDGPERAELERLAAARAPGRVRFVGFLESVAEFMLACDVLAFPTAPELSEGFGLAALEAMGAHRPVVVTNVGSLPEVVDDGVTGFVVEPGSPPALAAALRRLVADPALRATIGAAGAARARDVFPLDAMVSSTVQVYEELM